MKRGFTDDEAPVKIFYEMCSCGQRLRNSLEYFAVTSRIAMKTKKCFNDVGQQIGANFFSEHFNQP